MLTYDEGESLPDTAITWLDTNGAVIDFSSGWTFSARVAQVDATVGAFEKTDGILGAAAAPNLILQWDIDDEITTLEPDWYWLQVTASRTSDNRSRETRAYLLRIVPTVPGVTP